LFQFFLPFAAVMLLLMIITASQLISHRDKYDQRQDPHLAIMITITITIFISISTSIFISFSISIAISIALTSMSTDWLNSTHLYAPKTVITLSFKATRRTLTHPKKKYSYLISFMSLKIHSYLISFKSLNEKY